MDLDAEVIEVSRQYLGAINHGALDSPRVRVLAADGAEFVRTTHETYDLVLLDLTDPETQAGPLYTTSFFQECKRVMAADGAMVLHLGAPFYEPDQVRSLSKKVVAFLSTSMPMVCTYRLWLILGDGDRLRLCHS